MKKSKTLGIWIDLRIAYLLEFDDEKIIIREEVSEIDETNLVGGSRSKTPYGPMDVSAEPQHERRKQLQIDRFLNSVINQSFPSERLLLFGPGQIKFKLKKAFEKRRPFISNIETMPAPKMTSNQMKAIIREKFHLN